MTTIASLARPGAPVPALLLAGLLLVTAPAAARFGPPDFPSPPNADVTVVGKDMVLQGRETSVRMFLSGEEVEDVLEFYRELWAEPVAPGGPGYAAEDVAMWPWRLLTRVEDGYVMTVQVKEEVGGSRGFLAVSRLNKGGEPIERPTPPLMRGSEVFSNISHDDPGKTGQTVVARNDMSVSSNVEFYRGHFQSWRTDMDRALSEGRMHVLRFTRGRTNVTITLNGDDSGSEVVINEVRHSLL